MRKTKMYACFAFFPDGSVKRWKYVTNLESFTAFLCKSHPAWKYFNVYEKGTKIFMKRFYPGNIVPKELGSASHALVKIKATYPLPKTAPTKPYENTFDICLSGPAYETFNSTCRKDAANKTTFTNGFNTSTTIPTPEKKGGGAC